MSTTPPEFDHPPADGQPSEGPDGSQQSRAPQPQDEGGAVREARLQIETLKGEVADLKDRLLRAHAEMDNIRKRTEREKSEANKYAVTKFAHDIVTVGDNFQRAINTIPPGAVEETPALKSFLDGVILTERELLNALERHGIKRIDPTGEPFNPHLHQAVLEAPTLDVPAGTVVQVFQCGYLIEDRVLRPAMVSVAKGGARPGHPGDSASTAPIPEDETGESSPGPQDAYRS